MARGETTKGIPGKVAVTGNRGKSSFVALLAFAVLSAAVISGCAGMPNTSNTLTPQAAVQISPSSLTFPEVSIGQQATQNATITNTSGQTVSVTQLSSSSPAFTTSGLTFPLNLGPGQSAMFRVAFRMASAGSVSGTLSAMTSHGGGSTKVKLNGGSDNNSSQLSLSSTNLKFGNVLVNGSASQAVTLKNSGSTDLNISQFTVSGAGFSVSGVAVPVTLPAGQSASLQATFAPTSAGTVNGSVTITSGAATPTSTVTLSGTGVSASYTMSLTPASISFGKVNVGSSASQTIQLANTGNSSVTVSSVSATGAGISVSDITTPVTIAPSRTVPLTVNFAPPTVGTTSGSITVTNSDGINAAAAVTGTGIQAALSVSPTALSFGNVSTGGSATQAIQLKNTGTANLTISGASISGAGFTASGMALPATLTPGQSGTLNIQYAPSSTGTASGAISIASSAPNSPAVVALTGSGVNAPTYTMTLTPSALSFGNVNAGSSAAQTVALTNTGNTAVTISQVSASGNGVSVSGLSAGATIAPSQSVPLSVAFAPTTGGSVNGAISVTNSQGVSASAAVAGTGVVSTYSMSLSPSTVAFGNVNTGSTAAQTVTLTNTGNSTITISQVSASGTGVSVSGLSAGATLAASQSVALSVTYTPTAASAISGGGISVTNSQGISVSSAVTGAGVQPGISITPGSASFGSVVTGNTNSQTIQISNKGSANLNISMATVTGVGFSLNGLNLPLTLTPSQSTSFNVQFAPTAAGAVTGAVSITSNGSATPAPIALSGTGVAATTTLGVTPSSLSFGSVTDGTTASQSFTVTNTGNSNVAISGMAIGGTGYSILSGSGAVTLSPGQSVTATVQFAPTVAGTASGSISIASSATGSPTSVSLSGTGTAPVSHSVALSWTASTSTIAGYNVYRSTVSGSSYVKLNSSLVGKLNYSDLSVTNGTTYYYVTTAVDSTGNESVYSNEVSSTVP